MRPLKPMETKGDFTLILLFVLCYGVMYAQENRTEFTIEFRVARYTIDPNFRNNARELSELDTYIKRINAKLNTDFSFFLIL